MKSCVVIGGGIIGLCSAYYLALAGNQVTVLDKSPMKEGCSYGNAGMIVPSHVMPLAQPGMIAQGIQWMFDSKSPFYVKPRWSRDLLSWGFQFYRHATKAHVAKAMPALCNLSLLSKALYQDLASKYPGFLYDEKGLLMLYTSEKAAAGIIAEARAAEKLGIAVKYLSQDAIKSLEKGTHTSAIGAVHYESDAHLYPEKFMKFLKEELKRLQVKICSKTCVEDFLVTGDSITSVRTADENFIGDEFVLAGGAWSPKLAKKLKQTISILPGKGYSFTLKDFKNGPTIPSILCEGKVAVTPMGNDLRFGGTLEITHTKDTTINIKRLKGILQTINEFYPELQIEQPEIESVWYGFRPCTPSGLPLISRARNMKNLTIAAGHAMMGLSLAPATGKLVEELINGKKCSIDMEMFQ